MATSSAMTTGSATQTARTFHLQTLTAPREPSSLTPTLTETPTPTPTPNHQPRRLHENHGMRHTWEGALTAVHSGSRCTLHGKAARHSAPPATANIGSRRCVTIGWKQQAASTPRDRRSDDHITAQIATLTSHNRESDTENTTARQTRGRQHRTARRTTGQRSVARRGQSPGPHSCDDVA
jgi:hypothetical protein